MEKFIKFGITSSRQIEELNNFCSKITINIIDVLTLNADAVLVRYKSIDYLERFYFCENCINEFKQDVNRFDYFKSEGGFFYNCDKCHKEFHAKGGYRKKEVTELCR